AEIITQNLRNKQEPLLELDNITKLIRNYDYRLVPEYIWSLKNDEKRVQIFYKLFKLKDKSIIKKYLYKLSLQRFMSKKERIKNYKFLFVKNINDIFNGKKQGTVVYVYNETYTKTLRKLLKDIKGNLGAFIERQFDIPGRNAVVRQGLVKSWVLPNGVTVVSKRENLQKPGRFRKEQLNYFVMLKKFGNKSIFIDRNRKIKLKIAHPIAVVKDACADAKFAIFKEAKGEILEEIFIKERDNLIRQKHLIHYKLILETMYNKGILWGDISPRNILVYRHKGVTTYTLIDFEKSEIFDGPVPLNRRREHWRGQMFIEELAVACILEELLENFSEYFNPLGWDTKISKKLNFKLRPDIANLLEGRRIKTISLGEYNRLDREILSVRTPYLSPTGQRLFPGHIGFKVEHYLSCVGNKNASDYDRKTTEVLLAAKRYGCFHQMVKLLFSKVNLLEERLLYLEFVSILDKGFPDYSLILPWETQALIDTLDEFYKYRNSKLKFLRFLNER
ncbi:MAG: hypothetical protein ACPLXP_01330, partial [Microgenomates group bacterium]